MVESPQEQKTLEMTTRDKLKYILAENNTLIAVGEHVIKPLNLILQTVEEEDPRLEQIKTAANQAIDKLPDIVLDTYLDIMTPAEIDHMFHFYASALGRRSIQKSAEAAKKVVPLVNTVGEQLIKEVVEIIKEKPAEDLDPRSPEVQ